MRQIIHIYGASGSGTSTIGKMLSDRLGYRFMDTDDYFWMPTNPKFTTIRDRSERIRLMQQDIDQSENVVISGSLSGWGDVFIPQFTFAIRVVTDSKLRMERLQKRESMRFGTRIEPNGDMYDQHLEFMEWANQYDGGSIDMRSKAMHDVWEKLLQCPLIRVDGSNNLDDIYAEIIEKMNTD